MLVRVLGRGGMATVYEAHDAVLDRDVAVKVLPSRSLGNTARERLRREARIVARMDHPCVVPVFDLVEDDERGVFLIMPVLRGLTLRELLQGGPLTAPFAATVGLQIASALEYSHELGVVHRDIKPDNIMTLGASQGTMKIKVMDFGVARTAEDTAELEPGSVVGTIEYLSPEQVKGVAVDARSDVYSLGVLLFECLCGRPPFTGSMIDVMHRILNETPPPPRQLDEHIPESLDTLVSQCLRKDPAERPTLRRVQKSLREVPMVTIAATPGPTTGAQPPALAPTLNQAPVIVMANEATEFVQPLTGREDEIYTLTGAMTKTKRGLLQLCVLAGTPGMGKSRLLLELGRIADGRSVPMYLGHCRGRGEALPYHALCEIIRGFCEREKNDESVLQGLGELAPELLARFPGLSEVPSLVRLAQEKSGEVVTHDMLGQDEGAANLPLLELLARTFMIMGQGRPMIVAIEDLHRADVTVDALAYLSRRLESTPTMLVATYQPRFSNRMAHFLRTIESHDMGERYRHIELSPLDGRSHDELLQGVLGGGRISPETAERLRASTRGNPLAIRELVLGLRDSGALRPQEGGWSLASDHFLHARLPASLHAIVRMRLNSLDGELRELLTRVTILGEPFLEADIALLYRRDVTPPGAGRSLQLGFLVEVAWGSAGRSLAFANNVVREVLEQNLGRREQIKLHQRYAEGLVARHPAPNSQICHALAFHFAGAELYERALEYGMRAARTAHDAGGPEQAVRTLRMVLAPFDGSLEDNAAAPGVLEDAPTPEQVSGSWSMPVQMLMSDARMIMVESLRMLRHTAEARAEAERARLGYRAVDDRPGQLRALSVLAVLDWRERHVRAALGWVKEGLELVRGLDAAARSLVEDSLVILARVGQQASRVSGEHAMAERLRTLFGHMPGFRARTDVGPMTPDDSEVKLLDGVQLLAQGEYQAALAAVRELESRQGARTPLEARDEVRRRLQVAELAYQLGHYDEAVNHCENALALLADDDDVLLEATLMAWQGLAYAASGRFEDANHTVRDGFAVLALHTETTPAGRRVALALLFRAQGTILIGRGRPQPALAAFERSVDLSQEGSRARSIALLYAGLACVDAGRYEDAASYLTRSETAKRELEDSWGLVQNHVAWVSVLIDRGEIAEAKARVDAAMEFAAELGDPKVMAWLHWAAGRVHYMRGEVKLAERALQLGLRDAYNCQAKPEANRIHLVLTRAHRAMGHADLAWSHAEQARAMAYNGGSPIEQAAAQLGVGLLRMDRGEVAAAAEHFETSTMLAESVGNPYRVLDATMARAELEIARERYSDALARLDEVLERATELGARIHVADTWRARALVHEKCGDPRLAALAARRAEADFLALSLPASGVL